MRFCKLHEICMRLSALSCCQLPLPSAQLGCSQSCCCRALHLVTTCTFSLPILVVQLYSGASSLSSRHNIVCASTTIPLQRFQMFNADATCFRDHAATLAGFSIGCKCAVQPRLLNA